MSEGAVVGAGVGAALVVPGAAAALVAVAAIAAAGVAIMGTAIAVKKTGELILSEIEKERVAKQLRELEALQRDINDVKDAAEGFKSGVENWELKSTCKVLESHRVRHMERMKKAGLVRLPDIAPLVATGSSDMLRKEVARFQKELTEQENQLRQAITTALESHHAAQGVADSIGILADLPAPMLETPLSLLGYAEEKDRIQMSRNNASAVSAYRDAVKTELKKLESKEIPRRDLDDLAKHVALFNQSTQASQSLERYERIKQKISEVIFRAEKEEPLRRRLAASRAMAQNLLKEPDGQDIRWIYDECDEIDESKMKALEDSLKAAKARDDLWIRDKQQRLTLEATRWSLLNLGYKISVNSHEATWWKKDSLFFTRPEWGSHVVRLTYDQKSGDMRFYVGSMADNTMEGPSKAATQNVVTSWCQSKLPQLLDTLKSQNVPVSINVDINRQGEAIQKINVEEISRVDKNMVDIIRRNAKESRGADESRDAKKRARVD